MATAWHNKRGFISPDSRIYSDEYIRSYMQFLEHNKKQEANCEYLPPGLKSTGFAFFCKQEHGDQALRLRIDALLLPAAPYSVIAEDMGGERVSVEDIRTYEHLFFNIRDREGRLDRSPYLCNRFATGGVMEITRETSMAVFWKWVGFIYGYEKLAYMWGWRTPHDELKSKNYLADMLYETVVRKSLFRAMRGDASNLDMSTWMDHTINRERLSIEKSLQGETGGATRNNEAMAEIISKLMPRMERATKTAEQEQAETQAWQSKTRGAGTVGGHKLLDMGAEFGEQAVRKEVDNRFVNKE